MDYLQELENEQRKQIEGIEKGFDPFYVSDIEKGRRAQIGEVREWSDGKYRRTATGWEYIKGSDPRLAKKAEEPKTSSGKSEGKSKAEDFAAKHSRGDEVKSDIFTSIPEVEKTLQAKLSFIEKEQRRLENNKRMWEQKLKEVIPSISLLKENVKLAGLEWDPKGYSINKSGDSQDWKEGDKLYMSASLKPGPGFRFIKFDGYDSRGRDRKQAQLYEKAEKISEKLEKGTSLRISVNPYSLQIDPRKGEVGKSVMIEFWF